MKLEERLGANKYYVDVLQVCTHCKRTARLLLILQVVSNVAHVACCADIRLLNLGNILVMPRV